MIVTLMGNASYVHFFGEHSHIFRHGGKNWNLFMKGRYNRRKMPRIIPPQPPTHSGRKVGMGAKLRSVKLAALILSGFSTSLLGEPKPIPLNVVYTVQPLSEVFVAVDGTELKEKPDASSKTITKLAIGAPLQVIDPKPKMAEKIGLIDQPWYEVQTSSETPTKGYVWGGYFARAVLKGDHNEDGKPDVLLVRLFQSREHNTEQVAGRLVLAQSGVEIAQSEDFARTFSAPDFSLKELPNGKAFQPPVRLFAPSEIKELCDGMNGPTLFAFVKGRFIKGPSAISIGNEQGASNSEYIFPDEPNGVANHVLVKNEGGQHEDFKANHQNITIDSWKWMESGFEKVSSSELLRAGKGCPEGSLLSTYEGEIIRRLEIQRVGKPFQIIIDYKKDPALAPPGKGLLISVEDYNFDGCPDFSVDASGKYDKLRYVWDAKQKKYVMNEELSAFVGSPILEPEKKEITEEDNVYEKGKYCVWRRSRFSWNNGKLRKIAESKSENDPASKDKTKPYLYRRSSLVNGFLKDVERKPVSCDESDQLSRAND